MKIKEFNKMELLLNICNWYNYKLSFIDGRVVCDGSAYGADSYEHHSIEDALIDWMSDLEESDSEYIANGESPVYAEQIAFIKGLEFDMKTISETGELIVSLIQDEGFYAKVNWSKLSSDFDYNVGDVFRNRLKIYEDLKYAWCWNDENVISYVSDSTYDNIKEIVDSELEDNSYYFDDGLNIFIGKKTIEDIENALNSNEIDYTPWEKEATWEYIVETYKGRQMVVGIDDDNQYVVYFNESTTHHFIDDEGLISYLEYYLKEDMTTSDEDCECDDIDNEVSVKYDTKLEFVSLTSDDKYTVKLTPPILAISTNDECHVVNYLRVEKTDDKYNIVNYFNESGEDELKGLLKYFVGMSSEDLRIACHNVCEQEDNKEYSYIDLEDEEETSYILLNSGDKVEFNNFDDICQSNKRGVITSFHLDSDTDSNILDTLNKYYEKDIDDLKEDISNVLYDVLDSDEVAFNRLLDENHSLKYWDDMDIFYYDSDDRGYAIEDYLEKEEGIPCKAFEYMDVNNYFDNECNNVTVICNSQTGCQKEYVIFYK